MTMNLNNLVKKFQTSVATVWQFFGTLLNNGKIADAIMRWPRPAAFFMLVVMFFVGWHNPVTFMAFAKAISALPNPFWDVIFLILGSIGLSKGANDYAKIMSARTAFLAATQPPAAPTPDPAPADADQGTDNSTSSK